MGRCHLHLGSNQGDRKVQIARAIQMIEESIGQIMCSSAMYETAAWGKIDENDFINMALEVEHYMSPTQLLKTVNQIEDRLGRIRIEKWGSRIIDIDIIFIEDTVIKTDKLTIPHSLMHKRNFVLEPMVEIAPEFIHPIINESLSYILEKCEDTTAVTRIELF